LGAIACSDFTAGEVGGVLSSIHSVNLPDLGSKLSADFYIICLAIAVTSGDRDKVTIGSRLDPQLPLVNWQIEPGACSVGYMANRRFLQYLEAERREIGDCQGAKVENDRSEFHDEVFLEYGGDGVMYGYRLEIDRRWRKCDWRSPLDLGLWRQIIILEAKTSRCSRSSGKYGV
jgi:hypothetical protein